jgi:hypothetical protein
MAVGATGFSVAMTGVQVGVVVGNGRESTVQIELTWCWEIFWEGIAETKTRETARILPVHTA